MKTVVADGRILPSEVLKVTGKAISASFHVISVGSGGNLLLSRSNTRPAALLGTTLDASTTLNDNNLLFPLHPSFPSLSAENPGVRLFRLPLSWLF